jgi:hypothetical protein
MSAPSSAGLDFENEALEAANKLVEFSIVELAPTFRPEMFLRFVNGNREKLSEGRMADVTESLPSTGAAHAVNNMRFRFSGGVNMTLVFHTRG